MIAKQMKLFIFEMTGSRKRAMQHPQAVIVVRERDKDNFERK